MRTLLPSVFGPLPEVTLEAIERRFRLLELSSGEVLFEHGDECNGLHVVLAGRLEARVPGGRAFGMMERGDCAGEIALVTGARRTATVAATRSVVVAHLTREDLDQLVRAHPEAGLGIARLAIRRLTSQEGLASRSSEVRTIALVPLDARTPVAELSRRLEVGLLYFGSACRLDRRTVEHRLSGAVGAAGSAGFGGSALERLLDDLEHERRFVLYQAEPDASDWTLKCVGQADRVLFVAEADGPTELRAVERQLAERGLPRAAVERDLVLIHRGSQTQPANTASWLSPRSVGRHFHVSWEGRRGIARLARVLAGEAVSLVLGGGGARGFAQIGAVRAIREAGIPIDAVGGTSIGSVVGACVALDWQDERIFLSIKRAIVDERPMDDYTIPVFALTRGEKMSRSLARWFGAVDIADTWVPFFCMTSNLSRSCSTVHRTGPLWKGVRASVSLPGILPPLVYDGELHVDGGVLDNLPVSVMKSTIGGRTIAVDSSVSREYTVDRDTFPSPYEHLRARLTSGSSGRGFPTLASVVMKTATLGGDSATSAAQGRADLYLNPPTGAFDLLDWDRIFELVEVGYRYTRERLPAWIEAHPEVVKRDEQLEFRLTEGEFS